jgi:dUTP pyrophosphatase
VQKVERASFTEVSELPATLRGTGGFGSTGGVIMMESAAADEGAGSGVQA